MCGAFISFLKCRYSTMHNHNCNSLFYAEICAFAFFASHIILGVEEFDDV